MAAHSCREKTEYFAPTAGKNQVCSTESATVYRPSPTKRLTTTAAILQSVARRRQSRIICFIRVRQLAAPAATWADVPRMATIQAELRAAVVSLLTDSYWPESHLVVRLVDTLTSRLTALTMLRTSKCENGAHEEMPATVFSNRS